MNFGVVFALLSRYLYLYTRTWTRFIELLFWPVVDLLVWGNLTLYLREGPAPSVLLGGLIGGMILWDILFRSQQGVAISFLEDVWTRNLLNVFAAPVRTVEYLAATFGVGLFRITVTGTMLFIIAWTGYAFNLTQLGPALIPFFINLLIFGWGLGMISTSLILRWGQAAESLAWAVPFFIQPLVAVFYPVTILPAWLQPLCLCIPCTHVFEGMRDVLSGMPFPTEHLIWASALNVIYLFLAGSLFFATVNVAKKRGQLTKVASH